LDHFFDNDFFKGREKYPRADLRDKDSRYVLEADLPGLSEKEIEVKIEDDLLTRTSKKSEEKKEKKKGYLVHERRSVSFRRSFVFPKNVDGEKIAAHFKNGLLTMTLSEVPQAASKKIAVKTE